MGIDEVEVRGPLERLLALDLVCPLQSVSGAFRQRSGRLRRLRRERRTVAAGPREKFHVALRVECTNVAAFGARNWTGARIYAHHIRVSD